VLSARVASRIAWNASARSCSMAIARLRILEGLNRGLLPHLGDLPPHGLDRHERGAERDQRQYDRGDNGEPNRYAGGDEMDTCMLKTPDARRHDRSDGQKRPGNDKRNKGCHLRGRPRPTVGMAGAPHTGMSDGSDAALGGRHGLRNREGLKTSWASFLQQSAPQPACFCSW
jgi:hypothetical protein